MDIKARLLSMQDTKYRDFSLSLIPNISCESVIGVRIPQLRALSAELVKSGEYTDFIKDLPHNYFEEYHLHSFVISRIKLIPFQKMSCTRSAAAMFPRLFFLTLFHLQNLRFYNAKKHIKDLILR